jgi:uncharacterized metal-binding protein
MQEKMNLSCVHCGVFSCGRLENQFPDYCLTTKYSCESDETCQTYREDEMIGKMARVAGEIEGLCYGKTTRVEELILFAKKMAMKKIGIAYCRGLINEAKIFARILEAKGLESYGVMCKAGAIDKPEIGIPDEHKVQPESHESICNPLLQAEILNQQNTDLNVIIGLCIGHDSLFNQKSVAPVTTLIVKDRILGHNPAAALYNSNFFYQKLLIKDR